MSTRGFPITQARRSERRAQAEARQAEYDKLSLQEKLDGVPGKHAPAGKKVRAKLELQTQKLAEKKAQEKQAQEAATQAKAVKAEAAEKKNKK